MLAATLFAPVRHASAQQPAAQRGGGQAQFARGAVAEKNKHEEDENDAYRHSPAVRKIGAMLGLNAEQAATAFTVAQLSSFWPCS